MDKEQAIEKGALALAQQLYGMDYEDGQVREILRSSFPGLQRDDIIDIANTAFIGLEAGRFAEALLPGQALSMDLVPTIPSLLPGEWQVGIKIAFKVGGSPVEHTYYEVFDGVGTLDYEALNHLMARLAEETAEAYQTTVEQMSYVAEVSVAYKG